MNQRKPKDEGLDSKGFKKQAANKPGLGLHIVSR